MSTSDPDHGYHASRGTPEESLLAAIVRQAVLDLEDSDETVRYEANQFFLRAEGDWAAMRRFYFGALGLDEAQVLKALSPKLAVMAAPVKKEALDSLLSLLPDGPFTAKAVMAQTGREYAQIRSWLEHLKKRGIVVRTGRGEFCRADCLPTKPEPRLKAAIHKPADVRRVVYGLLQRPHSFSEIIAATGGDVSDGVIRRVLNEGRDALELSRDDDGRYQLVA